MAGIRRDVSVGAEPSFAEAEDILGLAQHHGFSVFVPEVGYAQPAIAAAA
jgi:hypothetical protein